MAPGLGKEKVEEEERVGWERRSPCTNGDRSIRAGPSSYFQHGFGFAFAADRQLFCTGIYTWFRYMERTKAVFYTRYHLLIEIFLTVTSIDQERI